MIGISVISTVLPSYFHPFLRLYANLKPIGVHVMHVISFVVSLETINMQHKRK